MHEMRQIWEKDSERERGRDREREREAEIERERERERNLRERTRRDERKRSPLLKANIRQPGPQKTPPITCSLQGYLIYKKTHPPGTLPQAYA